jgi:ParB family chromosome partitioning protein
MKQTVETRPKLVQISSAWSSREGAPLGRNRYVELDTRKSANGKVKPSPYQKVCEKTVDATVVDGGRRGQTLKICADLACRVHHPNQPSPEQIERERMEERKRIERDKLVITVRHRILAAILERISTPLKKADLLVVAEALIGYLPHNQALLLAKRLRIELNAESASVQEQMMKQASRWDEAALCRFILEASLLHSAYHRPQNSKDDALLATATRYRVDVAKLQKKMTAELVAKQEKKRKREEKPKAGTTA